MKQYSKYKNSGIDWLGNIPEHWEVKRVKELFEYDKGWTPDSKNNRYYDDEDYEWATISDITDESKFLEKTSNFVSQIAVDELNMVQSPKGSLLYSFKLSIGKVAFLNRDMFTNEAILSIFPSKSQNLNFWYYALPYYLKFAAKVNIYGAPMLNDKLISNALIPSFSLSEQTSIAAYLDEKTANIDRRIELLRNKIDNYKQLRRSLISQVVTRGLNPDVKLKNSGIEWLGDVPEHWEVKRVKDCFEMNPFTSFQGITQNDEISFVPMECIRMGVIEKRIEVFSKISGGSYTPFQNGDILVSKVTPCFENGNIAIADDLLNGKGLGTSEIFVFRPIKMHTKFAFYLFVSDYIKNQGCKTMKGVGGLKRITPVDFYTESIPVPPLTEQTAIVAYLDEKTAQIDSIIGKCEKQIEQLSAFRRSLIAEAVTGKIKVC